MTFNPVTMEIGSDRANPFLDVLVIRKGLALITPVVIVHYHHNKSSIKNLTQARSYYYNLLYPQDLSQYYLTICVFVFQVPHFQEVPNQNLVCMFCLTFLC